MKNESFPMYCMYILEKNKRSYQLTRELYPKEKEKEKQSVPTEYTNHTTNIINIRMQIRE